MSAPPIIIAGAGLAAMTLAKCLKHNGIPNMLLERASAPSPNNYGMTLQPWAYRPLLEYLGWDESVFRGKIAIVRSGHYMGGKTSQQSLLPGVETMPGTFRCHRGRLDYLLRLDLDCRWSHGIRDVETSRESINIQFNNQDALQTKILIGADGVHSQVRKCLAPNVKVKVLPYVVFHGRRKMEHHHYFQTMASGMKGQTIIESHSNGVVLQIAVNEPTSKHIDLNYSYSRPARQDDPLHRPDRSAGQAKDIPEGFYQELEGLGYLGAAFREIFDPSKVRQDRCLNWLMRSSLVDLEDIQALADRNVVLIGDATHAMPILRGEGGNTAMKDGVDLARHIVLHGLEGIKTFAERKYDLWKEGVEDSERKLSEMHSFAEPIL